MQIRSLRNKKIKKRERKSILEKSLKTKNARLEIRYLH